MNLFSLCLAASAVLSAQTAPAPTVSVYEHAGRTARLVLVTPAGEGRPQGVYYEGTKGRYMLRATDFERLQSDRPDVMMRYEIYVTKKAGLEYSADSLSAASLYRWQDESSSIAVETVIDKLAGFLDKKEAALECLNRVDKLKSYVSREEGMRRGFDMAEMMHPGAVLDAKKLTDLGPLLDAARASLSRAKTQCDEGVKAQYAHAPAAQAAQDFYQAGVEGDMAAAYASTAQQTLDGLPFVQY
jgi:hypothetical protein